MYILAMINKATMLFLRENIELSFEYIERKAKFNKQCILQWEDSADASIPTINQAKQLAKCFRVPFAGLYMNASDITLKHLPKMKNMRTIQGATSHDDSALNLAIIDLLNARELLIDTKNELGESVSKFSLSILTDDVNVWSNSIRALFNLELDKQYELSSQRKFYLYVRDQIEKKGIFVHCFTGVDTDIARGVAIYDDIMPTIGVNDEDRYPAKTFSIIHELVHIFKHSSSMCNDLYNSFSASQEEVFCNAVAGEVLVPQEALKIILQHSGSKDISEDNIIALAKNFSVSKEVIIRRLLDLGYINKIQYTAFASEFKESFERERAAEKERRKATGTPGRPRNMSMEAIDKTSTALCKALYRGVGEGLLDKQDISRYLEVGQKHIDKLMREVSKWDN